MLGLKLIHVSKKGPQKYLVRHDVLHVLLKTESCHDTDLSSMVTPKIVIRTTSGVTSDDKVGTMMALSFGCLWKIIILKEYLQRFTAKSKIKLGHA